MNNRIKLYFLTLFILTLSFQNSWGQTAKPEQFPDFKQAEALFKSADYYMAEQYYQKVLKQIPRDPKVNYMIAECSRNYFDYIKAEKEYKRVIDLKSKDFPLVKYWYARSLKYNGKYKDAEKYFEEFINDSKGKTNGAEKLIDDATLHFNGCVMAQHELQKPERDFDFTILESPVNSQYLDYAPCIYKNDTSIIITSNRPTTKGKLTEEQLGGKNSDNLRFHKKGKKWVEDDDNDKFSILNTPHSDGAGVFNNGKNKFYFTRCDLITKESAGECAIYVSVLKGDQWQKATILNENINLPNYWNAQPALSVTNDTLYFVSKRPGGAGMHDIWFSTSKGGNDNWGKAQNLKSINTPNIEVSPTVFPRDHKFYFASDGWEGFGGLDIQETDSRTFTGVRNIGLPFNSSHDDFYFVLGEQIGYLASNRGKGKDDIYTFEIASDEALIAVITKDSVAVTDKTMSIKGKISHVDKNGNEEDVDIILADFKGRTIKTTKTTEDGKFRFEGIPTGQKYKILLAEDANTSITTKEVFILEGIQVEGSKKSASTISFENIYFDFDSYDLRPEAKKTLEDLAAILRKNPHVQMEIRGYSDSVGILAYNNSLSVGRAQNAADYLRDLGIEQSGVVYGLGDKAHIGANDNPAGRQLNRRIEFYLNNIDCVDSKAYSYVLEPKDNIYTVAKKFGMTPESLKKINGITEKDFRPFRAIRVYRGKSTGAIYNNSIEIAKSNKYKELNLLYDYFTFKDGQFTSGADLITDPSQIKYDFTGYDLKDYIVQSGDTFYSIAIAHNMTLIEFGQLNNNITGVKAGQKVRVKRVH